MAQHPREKLLCRCKLIRLLFTITSKLNALYRNHDVLRYFIFGGVNTVLTWISFSGLTLFGVHYLVSNSLAWIQGILVSFAFNLKYVFKSGYQHRRFCQFVGSNIFSFFLSTSVLALLIDGLNISSIIASLIAIPVVVVANFVLYKHVVFKQIRLTEQSQL
jgi:putative flippase GtrA